MLRKILQEIALGNHASPSAFAKSMGLSPQELEDALHRLTVAGYLKEEVPAGCENGCAGCLRHCRDRMPVFRTLTQKGMAQLNRTVT